MKDPGSFSMVGFGSDFILDGRVLDPGQLQPAPRHNTTQQCIDIFRYISSNNLEFVRIFLPYRL